MIFTYFAVEESLHKGLWLLAVPIFHFSILFPVPHFLLNNKSLGKRDRCPVLTAPCFKALRPVSDLATANPVVKANQTTLFEKLNCNYFGDILFIITQPANVNLLLPFM